MASAVLARAGLAPFRALFPKEMHEITTSETAFCEKMAQDHWDKGIVEDSRRKPAKPPD